MTTARITTVHPPITVARGVRDKKGVPGNATAHATKAAVRRFVDANHYDFPVLIDPAGQFGAAYNITAVPTEILIGSNGQILWDCPGGPNWSDSQIRSEFRKLL